MKTSTYIFLSAFAILNLSSCKKEKTDPTIISENPVYLIKTAIHHANEVIDTTTYTYNSNLVNINVGYNNSPGIIYRTNYTKFQGYILSTVLNNNTKTMDGYIKLNKINYADSVANIRANGTINNKSIFKYDANGNAIQEIQDYITYENNIKKYYSNGNFSHWIYQYTNRSNPNQNRTDSIVFEYNTKPFVAFYKSYLAEIYGKPQKNLVKKRTYYNALTKVAYQTWEYNYETDNMGLVTKETWNIYTLPNNVLERTESTYFTYLKP